MACRKICVALACALLIVSSVVAVQPKKTDSVKGKQQKTLEPKKKVDSAWDDKARTQEMIDRLKKKTSDHLIVLSVNDWYKSWPLLDSGTVNFDYEFPPVQSGSYNLPKKVCMPTQESHKFGMPVAGGGTVDTPVPFQAIKKNAKHQKAQSVVLKDVGSGCEGFPKALGGGHNFVYDVWKIRESNPNAHILVMLPGDFLSPSYMSLKGKKAAGDLRTDQGRHITELMNLAHVDVCVFGNHEFDIKLDGLKQALDERIGCVTLAANLNYKSPDTGLLFANETQPTTVKTSCGIENSKWTGKTYPAFNAFNSDGQSGTKYRNSKYITIEYDTQSYKKAKVCIVGSSEDQAASSGAKGGIATSNHVDTARNIIINDLHEKEKCDLVIAATHHLAKDDIDMIHKVQSEIRTTKKHEIGVDIVAGAHDHFPIVFPTRFAADTKIPVGSGTSYAKFGSDAKYIGAWSVNLKDHIEFRKHYGTKYKLKHPPVKDLKIFAVNALNAERPWVKGKRGLTPDKNALIGREEMKKLKEDGTDSVKFAKEAMEAMLWFDANSGAEELRNKKSTGGLNGVYASNEVRSAEERATNLLSDYMRLWSRADVIGLPGGGIRGDIKNDVGINPFSALDFNEEFPFGGQLGFIKINGERLAQIITGSLKKYDPYKGNNQNLIHLSGAVALYDAKDNKVVYLATNPGHIGGRNLQDGEKSPNPGVSPKLIYCDLDKVTNKHMKTQCEQAEVKSHPFVFGSMSFHLDASGTPPTKDDWGLKTTDRLVKSASKPEMNDIVFQASEGKRLAADDDKNAKTIFVAGGKELENPDVLSGDATMDNDFASKVYGKEVGVNNYNVIPGQLRLKIWPADDLAAEVKPTNNQEAAQAIINLVQNALKDSKSLLQVADEILRRYAKVPEEETSESVVKHFKSLNGADVDAFVEEAVGYGFPKKRAKWLSAFAENALERAPHEKTHLGAVVKTLHRGLHHLFV